MKTRVFLGVMVILIVCVIGYAVWKSRSAEAGGHGLVADCDNGPAAKVTYDYQAPDKITVTPKTIDVNYPSADHDQHHLCWQLEIKNAPSSADSFPFDYVKLEIHNPPTHGGGPVLAGEPAFKKNKLQVRLHYFDTPVWSQVTYKGQKFEGSQFTYDVAARLKDRSSDLTCDPDIIIRK